MSYYFPMRLVATLELPRKCDHPHKTQFSVRALNIRELAKALAIHTVKIYPIAALSATADCKLCEYEKEAAKELIDEIHEEALALDAMTGKSASLTSLTAYETATGQQNTPKSPEVAPQAAITPSGDVAHLKENRGLWWPFK